MADEEPSNEAGPEGASHQDTPSSRSPRLTQFTPFFLRRRTPSSASPLDAKMSKKHSQKLRGLGRPESEASHMEKLRGVWRKTSQDIKDSFASRSYLSPCRHHITAKPNLKRPRLAGRASPNQRGSPRTPPGVEAVSSSDESGVPIPSLNTAPKPNGVATKPRTVLRQSRYDHMFATASERQPINITSVSTRISRITRTPSMGSRDADGECELDEGGILGVAIPKPTLSDWHLPMESKHSFVKSWLKDTALVGHDLDNSEGIEGVSFKSSGKCSIPTSPAAIKRRATIAGIESKQLSRVSLSPDDREKLAWGKTFWHCGQTVRQVPRSPAELVKKENRPLKTAKPMLQFSQRPPAAAKVSLQSPPKDRSLARAQLQQSPCSLKRSGTVRNSEDPIPASDIGLRKRKHTSSGEESTTTDDAPSEMQQLSIDAAGAAEDIGLGQYTAKIGLRDRNVNEYQSSIELGRGESSFDPQRMNRTGTDLPHYSSAVASMSGGVGIFSQSLNVKVKGSNSGHRNYAMGTDRARESLSSATTSGMGGVPMVREGNVQYHRGQGGPSRTRCSIYNDRDIVPQYFPGHTARRNGMELSRESLGDGVLLGSNRGRAAMTGPGASSKQLEQRYESIELPSGASASFQPSCYSPSFAGPSTRISQSMSSPSGELVAIGGQPRPESREVGPLLARPQAPYGVSEMASETQSMGHSSIFEGREALVFNMIARGHAGGNSTTSVAPGETTWTRDFSAEFE